MFNKLYVVTLLLVTTLIFGQDADTTDFEEEGGNEMFTSVDLSYSQDKGNTDFLSLYYGFSFSVLGDLGPLTDTEFSINFSRSDDKLDGESFSDDQSLTSQFDLWANQRISPFLFFQKSYDKTIGLENRMNAGAGAKIRLLKGFSISYAFLFENESYKSFEISGVDSTLEEADKKSQCPLSGKIQEELDPGKIQEEADKIQEEADKIQKEADKIQKEVLISAFINESQ